MISSNERPLSPPESWIPPLKTCIIAAQPRCGSTLLAKYMQDSDVLGRPDEHFNTVTTEWAHPGCASSVIAQCHFALSDGASSNGTVAFKLMPYQRARIEREIDITAWFPNARWIHLRRGDLLAQAISYEIAMQTEAWTSRHKSKREPSYSTIAILRRLNELALEDMRWKLYFGFHQIEPLGLYYEDLTTDPDLALRKVAGLLEVALPTYLPRSADTFLRKLHVHLPRRRTSLIDPIEIQRTAINSKWHRRFLDEWPSIEKSYPINVG